TLTQLIDGVVAQSVTQLISVPVRPAEQALQPVRAVVPGLLSQLPTVATVHIRQQREQIVPTRQTRPAPPENASGPSERILEQALPTGRVYHSLRGHRGVRTVHNRRSLC